MIKPTVTEAGGSRGLSSLVSSALTVVEKETFVAEASFARSSMKLPNVDEVSEPFLV